MNTISNKVVRILGKDETSRWMNLALYQGAPSKKGFSTIVRPSSPFFLPAPARFRSLTRMLCLFFQAMAASANPLLAEREARDPTLFATAFKKQRFYLFSRSEPESVFLPLLPFLPFLLTRERA